MKKGCVLKGIAFLAGTFVFSVIAPSGVHAEYYVSKHREANRSHLAQRHNVSNEPWIDVDVVRTEPERVIYHQTVENHYYYDDDDDERSHRRHRHYKPHKYHHNHHRRNCCLPPGWYTRIKRGCVIPSDIYVYREPVPSYVLVKMPPQPPGVVHIMVGGKVIRLMEATKTIMDVFEI